MFLIRRIYDDFLSRDREAIAQVQNILRSQFKGLKERDIVNLPKVLGNPLKYRFRSIIFVAENNKGTVRGFALVQHAPDLDFCYLDYISVDPNRAGRGIGGALYERVRGESKRLAETGLFFECLPDDPLLCRDREELKQSRKRLKFYEQYNARPIINTAYETPLKPGDDCPPYLVLDSLGRDNMLSRSRLQAIIEAILTRKYGRLCPPGYIDMIVSSVTDDPVKLRPNRYRLNDVQQRDYHVHSVDNMIALVVNDKHEIHHVHERGYVEAPVRIGRILGGIEHLNFFDRISPRHFSEKHIRAVHDHGYVDYFKRMCTFLESDKSIYPYVFPIRNKVRPPKEMPIRVGYYCIDTFTPMNKNAYLAARGAVDCALTASRCLLWGYRIAYALVRPPGHHAEEKSFGGFCYFNSAAVSANYLSEIGKVAVLDIDYHHGNGTQDIFYKRSDVLTLSIHGNPSFAYPYFSGFADERGEGAGEDCNVNYALDENIDGAAYAKVLDRALRRIRRFHPRFLVVALGLDTARGDPTGTWMLSKQDFYENGYKIGSMALPTVAVQEGGYRTKSLGANAGCFFQGLWEGFHGIARRKAKNFSR
ncbi:MAG: acetylpolyamine amidohydrolase [Deltaproteobacteria bacterium]|nr:acetylpolyamine amidohydrolase [Deltaproteobacteria bacterium]